MTPAPALSETAVSLCIFFILLVPLAGAGLSLIDSGLGRSHSAAHSMLAALCAIGVAAVIYFSCGFAWQGYIGRPAHVFQVAGKAWNWLASERFFFRGLDFDGSPASLAAGLQMLSVGVAALIPLGSGAGRWRLGAICMSTALLAGCTYPLFAHWVWSGGWLEQLGVNYGLGHGFVDVGGSATIQTVGGLTALAIAWILGPRRGKYSLDGMPTAIPGHNAVIVLFACLLAWLGWIGLNSAGAILFAGMEPRRSILILVNTTLAAVSAALAAAGITSLRFGKPDASLSANGWFGGLVASSASCAFVTPLSAVMIGLGAGALITFAVELLELRLTVDDPGGAISVHAVGGIWGLLALGIFAHFPEHSAKVFSVALPGAGKSDSGQLLAQLVGIATLLGFVLPLTYAVNWCLNWFYPQRVSPDGEPLGMDIHELGAGAYPDFVSNIEEFTQR
jgi:ammonium transporter, Amt family